MARIDAVRAIRRFCLACQGQSTAGVRACADDACALWACRLPPEPPAGDAPPPEETAARRRAMARAARRQCMACAGHRVEIRACDAGECPLWPWRFGVRLDTYRAVRTRFFAPRRLSLL